MLKDAIFSPPPITRTAKTEDTYREIANSMRDRYLRRRAEREGKLHIYLGDIDTEPGEVDSKKAEADDLVFLCSFTELATWIAECAKEWRPSTLRLRRSALSFLFQEELAEVNSDHPEYAAITKDYDEAIGILFLAKAPRKKDVPPVTSAKKQKMILAKDLEKLGDYIRETNGKWRTRGFRFLLANIVTGLRPVEWETVQVDDNQQTGIITLIVTNAKATNGRGNGPTRTLTFESEHERNIIRDHLYELTRFREEEPDKPFDNFRERAARRLYEACKHLWPQRKNVFSLYTGRHQFAANAKAGGATREEVANLMGHESSFTASKHYGKKRSGWAQAANKATATTTVKYSQPKQP